mmetsp:Transcript_117344/g.309986  ORF Transcript_117344/g.309986 Transcript_117344/m.309986 type:complete len:252 (+) Transcript_117344:818-1573(+)
MSALPTERRRVSEAWQPGARGRAWRAFGAGGSAPFAWSALAASFGSAAPCMRTDGGQDFERNSLPHGLTARSSVLRHSSSSIVMNVFFTRMTHTLSTNGSSVIWRWKALAGLAMSRSSSSSVRLPLPVLFGSASSSLCGSCWGSCWPSPRHSASGKRSSCGLWANMQSSWAHFSPATTEGHIFVKRRSGSGRSSASLWANMHLVRFLQRPRLKKKSQYFVFWNLLVIRAGSSSNASWSSVSPVSPPLPHTA